MKIKYTYTTKYHQMMFFAGILINLILFFIFFTLTHILVGVGIISLMLSLAAVIFINFKFMGDYSDNFSTYLYVRVHLKTEMSFSEIKQVAFLFNGALGKWYPLEEVKNLPKKMRKDFIKDFAQERILDEILHRRV